MRGSLTIKVTRGTTGRSGYHQKNDQPTSNYEVQEFVKKMSNITSKPCWLLVLIRNPLTWRLIAQVRSASKVGLNGDYFRSRAFSNGCSKPSAGSMGAPPLDKQGNGRYTEGNDVVLYLSKNPRAAAIESSASEQKPRIFIQQFCLNITRLRVLSLTDSLEDTHPHLHYLLLNSEYLIGEASHLSNPYRATQFISFLCRLCRVNAVEYPSVRGDFIRNPDAINLVIFGRFVTETTKMMHGDPCEFKFN